MELQAYLANRIKVMALKRASETTKSKTKTEAGAGGMEGECWFTQGQNAGQTQSSQRKNKNHGMLTGVCWRGQSRRP